MKISNLFSLSLTMVTLVEGEEEVVERSTILYYTVGIQCK